jgi:glycosyltransferase involved in cell wall biosynthesis
VNYRILHVIHSANAAGGGPIEGVKLIISVHQQSGHESEVLTLDSPDDAAVKSFPVRCHAMGPGRGGYGYSARFVPWLRANQKRFHVVVVHGIWQYSSFGAWRALAGTSTPYFVFTHGMLDPWFKRTYPLKHVKKWLYWPWADYRVLRDAQGVCFTGEEERRLARKSFWLYRCREVVVGFGATDPSGDPQAQQQAFADRFPQTKGKRCLLFLGRVHVKKGPDLLLQAFARTLATRPDAREVRLIMAGPYDHAFGQQMVGLAQSLGLNEHIIWTGLITGDVKWGAFRASDAFILPSHQENFGVAVAESLACGLPVLISNQVNIWREIEEGGAGFVEPDNLEGTERLLDRWLASDHYVWAAMRSNARSCFERRFDIKRTAENLLGAIQPGQAAKS